MLVVKIVTDHVVERSAFTEQQDEVYLNLRKKSYKIMKIVYFFIFKDQQKFRLIFPLLLFLSVSEKKTAQ